MTSDPRTFRNDEIWTCNALSSTTTLVHTRLNNCSLVTRGPARSTRQVSTSNARGPKLTMFPALSSRRSRGWSSNMPKRKSFEKPWMFIWRRAARLST